MAKQLIGGYLTQKRWLRTLIFILDSIFFLFFIFKKKSIAIMDEPKRILLSNGAHLGDVAILTSVLPAIKKKYPNVQIGLLIGSWAKPAVDDHLLVDKIHIVDHWKNNRANCSIWRKIYQYLKTRARALRELKKEKYDIAIDLFYYFPNTILLLWQAEIPIRIGYGSSGWGAFLTHEEKWEPKDQLVVHYHFQLMKLLKIFENLDYLSPYLVYKKEVDFKELKAKHPSLDLQKYVVFHIGSGSIYRTWPTESWLKLAKKCSDDGYKIVFVGKGSNEQQLADYLSKLTAASLSLCSLTWQELICLIKNAQFLVGLESIAGHIAAFTNTPSVLIYSQVTNVAQWRPANDCCIVIYSRISCGPCYTKGCSSNQCVKNIGARMVLEKLGTLDV